MGCSRISDAVRFPNAVTRANFSRRDQRASFRRAVKGSIAPALEEGSEEGEGGEGGVRERRSWDEGSMR